MDHIEGNFEGIDGIKLYYQAWIPDNPKAVIQVVHGFAEHSGRYLNVVNQLIPLNYAVYAHDIRGHGKSEGEMNYVDSMDQIVEDEKKFYDLIKERNPNSKIFMLGHSMGSGIAIFFANKYEENIAGMILSGAGKYFGGESGKLKRTFAKKMSSSMPKLKAGSGIKPNTLTRNLEAVETYKNDPLVHYRKITARLGWEMIKSFEETPDIVGKFTLPVLIQKGSVDISVTGVEELKDAFKPENLTYHLYEGLYHEVYNELEDDRKNVLKHLSDWLESHT
jgi:alpha-beta hydrolase superfamily lysophospholipase